ncbi:Phosphatidylserine synthase 1 [Echinococcus granulosus]|uniref:Phosphatidylserine synthase n=1 Tax=Echinococcus granulosus TaxID=6210 RepID=A0A068WPY6_ECHGR|nr:Phosphatidylserine synthase 1 [Echinococcus granulosus]CDS22195.1 phosphatidylserine synthase 1 [Echinococcus granulosus]
MHGRYSNSRRRLFSESAVEKEYFRRNVEQQPVQDISINVFYQPRSITVLFLIVVGLTYFAFTRPANLPLSDCLFNGAIVSITVFLIISTMIMPNGPFVRPHPLVWRVVFGASLLYLHSLVFVLFLRLEDARKILFYLDPSLERMRYSDILDKEYAVNCSQVTLERIWSHVDVFAFGHFFGWVVKAILLRHYFMLWTLSINWEVTEVAFSHILPNFRECWWDSIVLDVLLCNGLGIFFGMLLCQWFHARSYQWESIRDIPSKRGKLKRAVLQFTPVSWTPTHWLDRNSSFKRVIQLSVLIFFWQMAELNIFWLKHVFIVRPSHFLTQLRIIITTLSSAPAIRQFYHYVTDDQVTRVGSQMWIFTATMIIETLVAYKLGSEVFEKAILRYIIYWLVWLVVSSFLTVWVCLLFAKRSKSESEDEEAFDSGNVILDSGVMPERTTEDEHEVHQRNISGYQKSELSHPAHFFPSASFIYVAEVPTISVFFFYIFA